MTPNILTPAAVLIAWSMVVVVWLFVRRMAAFKKAGIDMAEAQPGARYVDMESQMPAKANWLSHNYSHLMEQPTIFYAVVGVIALAGGGSTPAAWWAWG
jgi:uncharacterized MAPEG superfamily protein